jgi:hypothetical protein
MKQSHIMRCEVVTVMMNVSSRITQSALEKTIQIRLEDGWTLRATLSENSIAYLIFVRKEVKSPT